MLFIDAPPTYAALGLPCHVTPKFSTRITAVKSGDENRNRNWKRPLRLFNFPEVPAENINYQGMEDHWLVMGGPEAIFPLRNPLEFASVALDDNDQEPDVSGLDQALGTGDGLTSIFQLSKRRTVAGVNFDQPIYLPVLDSIIVLMNGLAPGSVPAGPPFFGPYTATVEREGGSVTFSAPPTIGMALTWGGFFDVPVRYETDDALAGIMNSRPTAGFAALSFQEVRWC